MKKMTKVIVAFVAGQVVQLVIHGVALNLWAYRQIPFCIAGGFMVFFAVMCGVILAESESKVVEEKPAKEKTYEDWAEIPESTEILDPFKIIEENR